MKNTTAIILAAGLGTRMKTGIAKVLHKVGGKTMIERVLGNISKAGIKDIVIVVGHRSEEIKRSLKDHKVKFVKQDRLLGSGDALLQALRKAGPVKDNILVTCGDAPLIEKGTFSGLIRAHISRKVSCTLLTAVLEDPFSYGRVIRNENGDVYRIVEEKDALGPEKDIREINVGTYCFGKNDLARYIRSIKMNEKKREFYLTDIVSILNENGKKVSSVVCAPGEIIGINSRVDLAVAEKELNNRTLKRLMDNGVTIISPENTFIHETAVIGNDTVIFPFTIIEENVKISGGCKIGPYARIRPATNIAENVEIGNFVELCRTTVDEGSRVKHHTYLGDTIVGKNVNIGAGTITANYDGKNKNKTIIGDNAFIGVGAILIAPVKIGKASRVGAGSVVTKNKNVPAGKTVVGVPARIFE